MTLIGAGFLAILDTSLILYCMPERGQYDDSLPHSTSEIKKSNPSRVLQNMQTSLSACHKSARLIKHDLEL